MACYRIRTPVHEVPFLIRAENEQNALAEAARAANFELEEVTEEAFVAALRSQPEEQQCWDEYWNKEELVQRLVALSSDDFAWLIQEAKELRREL